MTLKGVYNTPYRLLWLQSLTVLLLRPITHHTGYYGYRVSQCSSCDQSHTIQVTMATESHSAPLATSHTPYRLLWLQSLTVLLLWPITHHIGYYGYRVSQCSSCYQSHTIQVTMATESHSAPLVTNHTSYRLLWLQSLTVLLLLPITHHIGYYGYRVSQCSSCDQSLDILWVNVKSVVKVFHGFAVLACFEMLHPSCHTVCVKTSSMQTQHVVKLINNFKPTHVSMDHFHLCVFLSASEKSDSG